jgi:predicted MPP superfamily phosphohydrolase
MLTRRYFLQFLSGLAVTGASGLAYAHWVEPGRLSLEQVPLAIAGLPSRLAGTRLVQLSDIHLCYYTQPAQLQAAINVTNKLSPDFVLLTGDFVSRSATYAAGINPHTIMG